MRRMSLAAVLFAACGGDTPPRQTETEGEPGVPPAEAVAPATPATDPGDVSWAPGLAVDLSAMERQESGLYIQVLREGTGPAAAAGDTMGVDYTVWLPNGSKLDSSFDHAPPEPLAMVLNETVLIDGWTEGVTGMRLGEKRRLVVPYDLAYGARGRSPRIAPYTPLVFEVELASHSPVGGR